MRLPSNPWIRWPLLAAGLLIAAQLVPVWLAQTNPPVQAEPVWDSPETRALAERACFDCHSNVTTWPWYSKVAPISWLVTRDVLDGRSHLNFSEWGVHAGHQHSDEAVELVNSGEMPPAYYVLMHPSAELTAAERDQLAAGLIRTLGGEGE